MQGQWDLAVRPCVDGAKQKREVLVPSEELASQRIQKCSFNTSSNTRGSSADVIAPNPAVPNDPFGCPSGGVLVILNASARISARQRSPRTTVLPAIRSAA